ncbi:hypothetical protein BC941DRAFT_452577 [Chlamydoabsidia padenii]|nr:hypothetical protein BC941DRAFT_452577 [Chlamydoabsidia padenii]
MATIQTTTDVASASYHFKKQKHLPYFLEYLMWVVFGSECLHLIWIKSDYKEYKEHAQHKIALFKELITLLESNSPVPDSLREEIRMVMLDEKFNKQLYQDTDIEDDYLEKLIAASEEADRVKTNPVSSDTSTTSTTPTDEHTKTTDKGPKKKLTFII